MQCACRKGKTHVSSSQNNLMTRDICDHIMLLLAAVMSDPQLRKEFESIDSAAKSFLNDGNDEYQWIGDVSPYFIEEKKN